MLSVNRDCCIRNHLPIGYEKILFIDMADSTLVYCRGLFLHDIKKYIDSNVMILMVFLKCSNMSTNIYNWDTQNENE